MFTFNQIILPSTDKENLAIFLSGILEVEILRTEHGIKIEEKGISLLIIDATSEDKPEKDGMTIDLSVASLDDLGDMLAKIQFQNYKMGGSAELIKSKIEERDGTHLFEIRDTDLRKWRFSVKTSL